MAPEKSFRESRRCCMAPEKSFRGSRRCCMAPEKSFRESCKCCTAREKSFSGLCMRCRPRGNTFHEACERHSTPLLRVRGDGSLHRGGLHRRVQGQLARESRRRHVGSGRRRQRSVDDVHCGTRSHEIVELDAPSAVVTRTFDYLVAIGAQRPLARPARRPTIANGKQRRARAPSSGR